MFVFFKEFLQINFIPVCSLVFLYIFLRMNDKYEHEVSRLFYPEIYMIFILLFMDNMEYYYLDIKDGSFTHTLVTVLGYNIRIAIMLSLMLIAMRDRKVYKNKLFKDRKRLLLYLPAVICGIVTMLAFWTHLVFWYGEDGEFFRGPLSYTPHFVSLFYSVVIFRYAVYIWRFQRRSREGLILILTTAFAIGGTAIESIFLSRGVLVGFISIAMTFYYLCIHVEYFKYDILTGAFNRNSFLADIQKAKNTGNGAVLSIDLNDLKVINDNEGHLAGDEALKSTASIIAKHITKKCTLYRYGGDEFAVIANDVSEDEIKQMIEQIKLAMGKTRYSFAIGYSMWNKNEKFEEAFEKADTEMYRDKAFMKGGALNIR